jgi:hypothetical protein
MSPTRPSFIETYRKLVSYVTFPDSVTAMFPELTIRQKYVLYGVVVFCMVGEVRMDSSFASRLPIQTILTQPYGHRFATPAPLPSPVAGNLDHKRGQ